MMTITHRASRAMPIRRVWATGRVPFDLKPVTAAKAVMMTARPSHASQVMAGMLLGHGLLGQRPASDGHPLERQLSSATCASLDDDADLAHRPVACCGGRDADPIARGRQSVEGHRDIHSRLDRGH